jgi:hypothetical protein
MMFHRSRKKEAASEKPEKVRRRNSDGVIAEFYLALTSVLGLFFLYGSFPSYLGRIPRRDQATVHLYVFIVLFKRALLKTSTFTKSLKKLSYFSSVSELKADERNHTST